MLQEFSKKKLWDQAIRLCRHVKIKDKAAAKAEYLATRQWGRPTTVGGGAQPGDEDQAIRNRKRDRYTRLRTERDLQFRLEDITVQEVRITIRKLKNNRAPGPDDIQTKMIKWARQKNIR
jgi:hypothetical protein